MLRLQLKTSQRGEHSGSVLTAAGNGYNKVSIESGNAQEEDKDSKTSNKVLIL